MTRSVSADELVAILDGMARERRILVAVAGPPGVGKSTTCANLAARANAASPDCCAVLGMDGYHFDDRLLAARGDGPRKGAPHTFDLGGLAAMIERLKRGHGVDVAVPVFDRDIEIARAGAAIVAGAVRIVLVEGNYLLLDAPGWRDLRSLFDVTVMLEADEAVLEARLRERWQALDGDAMLAKMEGNDLPNLRLVLRESRPADFSLRTDAGRGSHT